MAKYQVIQYFTTYKLYTVEADSEDEASNMITDNDLKPDQAGGPEFSDEMVELMEPCQDESVEEDGQETV